MFSKITFSYKTFLEKYILSYFSRNGGQKEEKFKEFN